MQRYTSEPLSAPKISLGHIPTGWRGTQKTVEHVQALIRAGAKDFYVRQKAIDILLEKHVKPKEGHDGPRTEEQKHHAADEAEPRDNAHDDQKAGRVQRPVRR